MSSWPGESGRELLLKSAALSFLAPWGVKIHRHAHAGEDRLPQGSRVATVPTDTTRPAAMARASSLARTGQVMGLSQVMIAPSRL
jgi:hypothetical protein